MLTEILTMDESETKGMDDGAGNYRKITPGTAVYMTKHFVKVFGEDADELAVHAVKMASGIRPDWLRVYRYAKNPGSEVQKFWLIADEPEEEGEEYTLTVLLPDDY